MTNAQLIIDAVSLPYTYDFGDGRTVEVERMVDLDGVLVVDLFFRRDGEPQPFNGPWKIVHPPIVTSAGVEDPAAAFDEIIASSRHFD